MATPEVNKILKRYGNDATDIIAILPDVQQTYRYLPKDVMSHLSEKLDIPLTRIYHLSTFFRAFSLEPRGKHHIQVCLGNSCHVGGAPNLMEALRLEKNLAHGQTSPDRKFSLEGVGCLGCCAMAPVVVVDNEVQGRMNRVTFMRLVESLDPPEKPS